MGSRSAYVRCQGQAIHPLTFRTQPNSTQPNHGLIQSHVHVWAAPSIWNSLPAGIRAFWRRRKTHCLIRLSVPPSVSHKYLRFGPWSTLYFTYLSTYLLTYFEAKVTIFCPRVSTPSPIKTRKGKHTEHLKTQKHEDTYWT